MITFYQGRDGVVKFNSTGGSAVKVTSVTAWTLDIQKEIFDITRHGDTAQRNVGGLISASGSVDLLYTGDNNSLIEAINTTEDDGSALFELYLNQSDNKRIIFNGIIESASYGASRDDVITISCNFVSTGSITLDLYHGHLSRHYTHLRRKQK